MDRRTSYNRVSHNEICDLYYTGVSVGWSWGYAPTSAHHNTVEFNHIHNIGRGVLGDMGGIYCLGDSPGTAIRNNLVHDVYDHHTGSLAIYTDEGSTGILIEHNIGYGTTYANFHQHYGKENVVRNNIWALGKDYQLSRVRRKSISRSLSSRTSSISTTASCSRADGRTTSSSWTGTCIGTPRTPRAT